MKTDGLVAAQRFVEQGEQFLQVDEPEMRLLKELVDPGSVVIDVGANVGHYTYALWRAVGSKGKVICIEPQPDLAQGIRLAAAALNASIDVINVGASARDSIGWLNVPEMDNPWYAALASLESLDLPCRRIRIDLRTLDEIVAKLDSRISFVKIDVEGHELQVLKGAMHVLEHHRPNWVIEVEQRHSPLPIEETFRLLENSNYQGFYVDAADRLQSLANFDKKRDQLDHIDDVFSRSYINNFIFRPAENVSEID